MRTYLAIARATWKEYSAYRITFFLEIIGTTIAMLGVIVLWETIYGTRSGTIGGYTKPELITYLLIAGIINSVLWLTAQGDEINDDINWGRIGVWLHRPVHVLGYWFTRDLARKAITGTLSLGVFVIILFFYRDSLVFVSWHALLLAILATFAAAFLHFILFTNFAIIAFWFEQTWGERFLLRVVMEVAAGTLVPLALFPLFWQKVFAWLPFRYMVDFPVNLYLGKVTERGLAQGFLFLGVWIVGLTIVLATLWKSGMKKYSAEGS